MRVLIVTQYFPPEAGAPQVRLAALARALQGLGAEVDVLTAMPNHPSGRIFDGYRRKAVARETTDGVRITRLAMYPALGSGLKRMVSYASFAAAAAAGLLVHRRPDLVLVESPPPLVFPAAWLRARLWRAPVVLNVADLWPDTGVDIGAIREGLVLRLLRGLERWCYRHADAISVPTEGLAAALIGRKGVPAEKVTFLPNGVDTDRFSPEPADPAVAAALAPHGEPVFLYAGTVGTAHGAEVAVRALALLRGSHPTARVAFMGGGSELGHVQDIVRAEGIDGVDFLGVRQPDDVASALAVAVAGLATLRAGESAQSTRLAKMFPPMACGRPLLFSGDGEGADLVHAAGAALVTPPGDAAALSRSMAAVLDDAELAQQLGNSGRQLVLERFTWGAIVSDWLEDLARALGRPVDLTGR